MDCARALARLNRRILETYSRRTTATLRASLPLRFALPHLEPFLARNVAKEIEKDRLVIGRVAEALRAGAAPDRAALEQLLEATKAIDREFLSRVRGFPVRIAIRYDDIAPVRLRRIERLVELARRMLVACRSEGSVRAALRACYPRSELEHIIREILRLYVEETLLLSRSVKLPSLLGQVREAVALRLAQIMEEVAARLASDAARVVYRLPRGEARRAE